MVKDTGRKHNPYEDDENIEDQPTQIINNIKERPCSLMFSESYSKHYVCQPFGWVVERGFMFSGCSK